MKLTERTRETDLTEEQRVEFWRRLFYLPGDGAFTFADNCRVWNNLQRDLVSASVWKRMSLSAQTHEQELCWGRNQRYYQKHKDILNAKSLLKYYQKKAVK